MTFQGKFTALEPDLGRSPWLAPRSCQCPGCDNPAQLRACGWTCDDHTALPYEQGDEARDAIERGIALMDSGIYAERP